jgi:tetratricopeptide (TPR) repeat protein
LLDAAAESGVFPGRRHRKRWGTSAIDRALARLVEHSLVTLSRDQRRISVHPFVMRVVRDQLAQQKRLAAASRAAAYVLDIRAGKVESSSERAEVRDVLLQINALLDNTSSHAAAEDDELAGMLLSLRSWALYHLNKLGDSVSQAVLLGESLVTDLELNRGRHHLDTLGARNNLAAAYQAAGRLDEAIPLFEETLTSREQILGHDHPDAMVSRNNLAAAYQAAGRLDEAIPLFEETLASREQILGHDHPSTATSWSNLGFAYREAGRKAEAVVLFEWSLKARKRQLGAGHPDTLTAWNDLNLARQEAARVEDI